MTNTAHALRRLVHLQVSGFKKPLWRTRNHHYHHQLHLIVMSSKQTSAMPPNFSWVEPHKLAGLACPSEPQHYRFLVDNGIKHLVCLLESKPPNYESCPELILHQISIVDFTPPTLNQILQFLSIVEKANAKGEAVAVHCMHGLGRTGTMLACYLVKTRHISGPEAIKEIRRLREGSIETKEQEQAVIAFQQYIQNCCQKH